MKKGQFTVEQIIRILQEVDAGAKVDQVCRRHGVSRPTYYQWRKRYGGLEVNEAKHLREIQEENRRLKRLVADQVLNIQVLKDILGKKPSLLNARHAPDQVISDAITMVAEAGGPETYLRKAAAQKPRWVKFRHYPTPMKLALQMVLFEESERAALEGELEALETAWREAEDLAVISDNLIEPKDWANEKARLESLGAEDADRRRRRG